MARPLRIEYPNAVYHVTARGNAHQAIFLHDDDQRVFLKTLEAVVARYNWLCHAYVLMDNHYHLLIETPDANLSRGMRQLNGVYTQAFNRGHGRVGHVFQGRFKALLVEKDAYLLALCRYIVRNPVAARLARSVRDWRWSSYRATAGLVMAPPFLSTDWVLQQFGRTPKVATEAYRAFVADQRNATSPWDDLKGQIALGSETFAAAVLRQCHGRSVLHEVPRAQRFADRPKLEEMFGLAAQSNLTARNAALARAVHDHGYSVTAAAAAAGLHVSTASRILKWADAQD